MRRSPLYFYNDPSFSSFHRPRHSFVPHPYAPSPPQPTSAPHRSVINIPVRDQLSASTPPFPPHSPSTKSPLAVDIHNVDPALAATTIQAHFRGYCIRRHRPLLQLRAIGSACKQLEGLKAELENPVFAQKLESNEKERLRYSESVMAVILCLDAIEGSISEVRICRKEATKIAIKLQDSVDAIAMLKDEAVSDAKQVNGAGPYTDSDSVEEGGVIPARRDALESLQEESADMLILSNIDRHEEGSVPPGDKQCNASFCPDAVKSMQEESAAIMTRRVSGKLGCDCIAESCMEEACYHHADLMLDTQKKKDVVDEMRTSHFPGNECLNDDNHGDSFADASDRLGLECLPPEEDYVAEKLVCKEAMDATEKETMCAKEDAVDNVESVSSDDEDGTSSLVRGDDESLCTPTLVNVAQDIKKLDAHGEEKNDDVSIVKRSNDGGEHEYPAIVKDDMKAWQRNDDDKVGDHCQSAGLTPSDRMLLQQLSDDSKQLKSMLSKLLVHSKAQSKVICALGDRLETLEHQQRLNCPQQHNQLQGRERRKSKKGSKK